MGKRFTKIICVIVAGIVAAGVWLLAGCSDYYTGGKLAGYVSDAEVSSNGGFVVEKGEYIYFINGSASYRTITTTVRP